MRWQLQLLLLLAVHGHAQIFSYPATPVNCSHSNAFYAATDLDRCPLPSETPFSTFPVPAVGSFYIDPNFGSKITVLARASANGAVHGYYAPSAFSATGKYAAIAINTFTTIVDAQTGAVIRTTPFGNVTYETLTWDAYNDDIFWWFSGTKLSKYQVSTAQRTDVLDFSTMIDTRTGRPYGFTRATSGGRSDTSKDNWKPMLSDQEHHQACVINLQNLHVYCADYTATVNGVTPGVITTDTRNGSIYTSKGVDSVSGKRYVMAISPTNWVIMSLKGDPNTGSLTTEQLGPEYLKSTYPFETPYGNGDGICDPGERCHTEVHSDTMEDFDGQQYYVGVHTIQPGANQERRLLYFRLNATGGLMAKTASEAPGGGLTIGWLVWEGGGIDYFLDPHVGCAKSAPYCVFSSEDTLDGVPISTTATSFSRGNAHQSVIAVIKGVNQEVRQIAYSKSPRFADDTFWAYPRACLSNDGSRVLFDSNLGYPNGSANENVLTVATGYGSLPALSCDLNGDGATNVADVQLAILQALGTVPCTTADLTERGKCGIIDVQRVVDTALGGVCKIGP